MLTAPGNIYMYICIRVLYSILSYIFFEQMVVASVEKHHVWQKSTLGTLLLLQ